MFMVMLIQKELGVNDFPFPVKAIDKESGLCGVCPIFETSEQAEAFIGDRKDVSIYIIGNK